MSRHQTAPLATGPLSRLTIGMIGVTTALHTATAFAQPEWREILRGGVWNTVMATDHPTMSTMWFTLAGAALGGIGVLAGRTLRETGALPRDIPWVLLGVGVPIAVLQPASGGWLVIGVGGLALAARRLESGPQLAPRTAGQPA